MDRFQDFAASAAIQIQDFSGSVYVNTETFRMMQKTNLVDRTPQVDPRRTLFCGLEVWIDDNHPDGFHEDWSPEAKAIYANFCNAHMGKMVSAGKGVVDVEYSFSPPATVPHIVLSDSDRVGFDALMRSLGKVSS